METALLALLLVFLVVSIALSIVLLFLQLRKTQGGSESLTNQLFTLNQIVQQEQAKIDVLTEKVSHLEPITRDINVKINDELLRVHESLERLKTYAETRQAIEQKTSEAINRLEMVIAGTQSKGSAGENIVEMVFAKLPIEWQERNFVVNGKSVEFGLRLPNQLILPIDSKWPATHLVEQFAAAEDPMEKRRLKSEIERSVLQKAREVSKYIDPHVTMTFGLAVIPDAVYDLSAGVQVEAFQMNVVLVSYSMFVPYLFLVVQTTLKTLQSIDLQKLDAYIQTIEGSIKAVQEELDGRFQRALVMLNNAREEMRAQMSKASGSLTSLQIGAVSSATGAALPETTDTPRE